jgi:aminoglycoside phosphotransferase (APT) family kinase protein
MYPEEKVRREVAVLKFLEEKTRVPVPKLIAYGSALDNHDPEVGPFIIMEWVEGVLLSSFLEAGERTWDPIVLRDDIDDSIMSKIYPSCRSSVGPRFLRL